MQKYQNFQHQKKVDKIAFAESAESGLQKAEGVTLQFSYGMLKMENNLWIESHIFADTFIDT